MKEYRAALLGRDISYTKSPIIHASIAEALGIRLTFDVKDTPYDALDRAVAGLIADYDGFFITKPYKTDVKRYLDAVETACGVNFVRCRDKRGYNTDGAGFIRALDAKFGGWEREVDSALVLGAGGAAYAVAEALIKRGKKVYVLNRTLMNAAKLCSAIHAEIYLNQPAELVVNATSLGLKGEDVLASLCVLPDFKYAYDLVYSPPVTPFLRRCARAGAKTANGEDMLIYQAIEGDAILIDRPLDVQSVFEATTEILNNKERGK